MFVIFPAKIYYSSCSMNIDEYMLNDCGGDSTHQISMHILHFLAPFVVRLGFMTGFWPWDLPLFSSSVKGNSNTFWASDGYNVGEHSPQNQMVMWHEVNFYWLSYWDFKIYMLLIIPNNVTEQMSTTNMMLYYSKRIYCIYLHVHLLVSCNSFAALRRVSQGHCWF